MTRFDWRGLARSTSGNVLPIACMGVIVLAGLVGGAVDASRAYMVQNRLQNACDSGVLAGRRAVTSNGYDEAAKEQANTYFRTNFTLNDAQGVSRTTFNTTADERGNEVRGTATARVQTAVTNLFGFETIDLNANCLASMSVGNSDVMMVLDVTGSMGSPISKMRALQSAMKNFYDTVAAAKEGSNARVRFGFVPYSSSVNVGRLLYDLNPDYLVDSYAVRSRVFQGYKTVSGERCNWKGCYTDTWEEPEWKYQQVTNFDYATYKSFRSASTPTGEYNNVAYWESTLWKGCIEERQTVPDIPRKFGFSPITGIFPAEALDLNIDAAPDPSRDETKWAPMWPEVAYYPTQVTGNGEKIKYADSDTGKRASSACPRAAQLLSEISKSDFYDYADSLVPGGNTYHDLGLIWGGRLSSPQGIFSANVDASPNNGGAVARHLVFMTDGKMEPSHTIQSSYGIEYNDRRITNNGSNGQTERHTARFLAVCEAIKAKGIHIWVVAFAVEGGITAELKACANSDSAFTTSNASELDAAFQDIAKEVGELRVVE